MGATKYINLKAALFHISSCLKLFVIIVGIIRTTLSKHCQNYHFLNIHGTPTIIAPW